jgi:hypothetical protein
VRASRGAALATRAAGTALGLQYRSHWLQGLEQCSPLGWRRRPLALCCHGALVVQRWPSWLRRLLMGLQRTHWLLSTLLEQPGPTGRKVRKRCTRAASTRRTTRAAGAMGGRSGCRGRLLSACWAQAAWHELHAGSFCSRLVWFVCSLERFKQTNKCWDRRGLQRPLVKLLLEAHGLQGSPVRAAAD